MPQPVAHGVKPNGDVEAIFNYQSGSVKAISTRRDGSATDGDLIGADWSPQRVLVRDGRAAKPAHTLHKNGFELRAAPSASSPDFYDERAVVTNYYKECEALVQRVTGARLVAAFDHNVRCEAAKALGRTLRGGGVRVEAPAALVHNDYGPEAAARRLRMLAEPPTLLKTALRERQGDAPILPRDVADDALQGRRRFAFVNVWRPIQPVESKPLGMLDAQSSGTDELVLFSIEHADEGGSVGGIFFASHRPQHGARACPPHPAAICTRRASCPRHTSHARAPALGWSLSAGWCACASVGRLWGVLGAAWYYFPDMVKDEVILLKQWDSDGGVANGTSDAAAGRATFALHSAFADPRSGAAARDRESIETRLVVVY